MPDPHYLYTYVPKDNTVSEDGLLSTYNSRGRISRKDMQDYRGWTKYKLRAVEAGYPPTFSGVCEFLDSTIPGFRRSRAISMLTEPIGDVSEDKTSLKEFKDLSRLYKVDPAKLIAAGIITNIAQPNLNAPGGEVIGNTEDAIDYSPVNWKPKARGKFGFSGIKHYFLETKDGYIPPEYVEEVK